MLVELLDKHWFRGNERAAKAWSLCEVGGNRAVSRIDSFADCTDGMRTSDFVMQFHAAHVTTGEHGKQKTAYWVQGHCHSRSPLQFLQDFDPSRHPPESPSNPENHPPYEQPPRNPDFHHISGHFVSRACNLNRTLVTAILTSLLPRPHSHNLQRHHLSIPSIATSHPSPQTPSPRYPSDPQPPTPPTSKPALRSYKTHITQTACIAFSSPQRPPNPLTPLALHYTLRSGPPVAPATYARTVHKPQLSRAGA